MCLSWFGGIATAKKKAGAFFLKWRVKILSFPVYDNLEIKGLSGKRYGFWNNSSLLIYLQDKQEQHQL